MSNIIIIIIICWHPLLNFLQFFFFICHIIRKKIYSSKLLIFCTNKSKELSKEGLFPPKEHFFTLLSTEFLNSSHALLALHETFNASHMPTDLEVLMLITFGSHCCTVSLWIAESNTGKHNRTLKNQVTLYFDGPL